MTDDGRWHATEPRERQARVRDRFGVWETRRVYNGTLYRHPADAPEPTFVYCTDTHYKKAAAETCAARHARRLNKEAAKP